MKTLLTEYNGKGDKTFEDILDFHMKFERIYPFQDGNGRVGGLIMFKECLYRGLSEWDTEPGYLRDTCLTAQDRYKMILDYFRIKY